jgi:hypothetical protein
MFDVSAKYKFDDKAFRAITSAVAKLDASRVRTGILGAEGEKLHPTGHGLKVWQVGALQEFGDGTGHIPERSFIRKTLNDLVWLRVITARAAQRVVQLKQTADSALGWLGENIVRAIQHTIMAEVPPANKPQTVDWKGHGHTLIGKTGVMSESISYDIVTGSAEATPIYITPGED